MENIHGLTQVELQAVMTQWQEPRYRARQIWKWLYVNRVVKWNDMANLPRMLRNRLASHFVFDAVREIDYCRSADGAGKLLLETADGERLETALIPAHQRRTVCVSSQIGCRHGCVFCASGKSGFARNLHAGEMIGQILASARVFGSVPTHLVLMGIGEPLDNRENLRRTLAIVNDQHGLAIGARRITVSTCGLVPGIRWLSGLPWQIELSVSLHAPDDELRSQLMPVNRKYPIDVLLAECAAFYRNTKRLVTFEYILIDGINDSRHQARLLADRLRRFPARVNLIPLSPVQEFDAQCASVSAQHRFMDVLQRAGINVTIRASRGKGVAAACGQLRATAQPGAPGANRFLRSKRHLDMLDLRNPPIFK